MIGTKVIEIQCDNIEIGGEMYMDTPGLWALITKKYPKEYISKDYERYKELLYETNLLYCDYNHPSSYPRANKLKKWTKILRPIWEVWEDFQWEGIVSDDEEEEYHSIIIGDGVYHTYLQKNACCFNVHRDSNGLHVALHTMLPGGNGLYICIWL